MKGKVAKGGLVLASILSFHSFACSVCMLLHERFSFSMSCPEGDQRMSE
jgi:hypothetical protein